MANRKHSDEFRDEAVKQITERGYSVKEVSARLGADDVRTAGAVKKRNILFCRVVVYHYPVAVVMYIQHRTRPMTARSITPLSPVSACGTVTPVHLRCIMDTLEYVTVSARSCRTPWRFDGRARLQRRRISGARTAA